MSQISRDPSIRLVLSGESMVGSALAMWLSNRGDVVVSNRCVEAEVSDIVAADVDLESSRSVQALTEELFRRYGDIDSVHVCLDDTKNFQVDPVQAHLSIARQLWLLQRRKSNAQYIAIFLEQSGVSIEVVQRVVAQLRCIAGVAHGIESVRGIYLTQAAHATERLPDMAATLGNLTVDQSEFRHCELLWIEP